ncbi:MAG TPA: hypothetical protein PLB55_09735 [Prosthecobacter sp.]|nr:hypothetical protein [Prosthecobacter sp.]
MPLGEFLGELIVRPIVEVIGYGVTYWTGYALLFVVTLGRLRMAPFWTFGTTNKRKWIDWSLFLQTAEGRKLKMEAVCLIGLLFWVGAVIVWFSLRHTNAE